MKIKITIAIIVPVLSCGDKLICANIIFSVITMHIFIELFFFSTSLKLHTDQDKGDGNLKYILTGDGAGSIFVIDENTGDIHAAKKLDREEKSLYILRAKAIDRKTGRQVEPESEFIIKIHDINDNEPKFTKDLYTASVPEMSGVGRYMLIHIN